MFSFLFLFQNLVTKTNLDNAAKTPPAPPQPPALPRHNIAPEEFMHKNETTNHPPPEATSSTIHQPLSPDSLQDNSDTHPLNPFGLFIRPHPTRGNGLFSPRLIPAGTVIEESPVLVLTKEQWEQGQMNGTILGEYGFCWSAGGMAIGLGLGESPFICTIGRGKH